MLVRQTKNTFIRLKGEHGYVMNQMTRWDRSYNETGSDYLATLSRIPQNIEEIVRKKLLPLYQDVEFEEIYEDYKEFITNLEKNLFVVTGETSDELDSKDPEFSYALGNMKTQTDDYTQHTEEFVSETTQDLNLESSQREPHLMSIQFELTSRCNERCIHCYIPNGKKNAGKDMPIEKVKSLIDEFAEMGGLHVTLSGGEAFLHPKLIETMNYCREKDMQISILSNLIALKEDQVKAIHDANVSIVQVSLYSMIPEHHDMITTVKGSFAKTKAAIEKLVAANVPVQISCPVMKANKSDYKDVLKYAQSLNIKAQTDYIMMAQADFDTQNLANRIDLEETEALLRDLIEFDIDYREVTLKQSPKSEEIKFDIERYKKQPLCGAGINDIYITDNGDVYPCAGWQAFVIGNVYNNSLKDIWENSEKIKQIRGITQGDFPQCIECEARDYCSMCLVRNFNESGGDMFKLPKHFCDVAFLNKRLVEEYQVKGLL
ncbi:MAG: radical SAM protein [Prevotellaceae bacterium]|nr:radical SAM protein [Candidatus Colivivens equi]